MTPREGLRQWYGLPYAVGTVTGLNEARLRLECEGDFHSVGRNRLGKEVNVVDQIAVTRQRCQGFAGPEASSCSSPR